MSDLPARLRAVVDEGARPVTYDEVEQRAASRVASPRNRAWIPAIAAAVVVLIAIGSAVLLVALDRSGDDPAGTAHGSRGRPTTPTAPWTLETNADGSITAVGFNEFIRARRPPWGESPGRAALELARRGGGEPGSGIEASSDPATPDQVMVVAELADDSVRLLRLDLVFRRDGDVVQLVSGTWTFQCHEGRGHQDFSLEPCI